MRSPALRAASLLVALCVAAAYGCSDTVAPDPAATEAGTAAPTHSLLGGLLVDVLQRTTPLARDYSAAATIGEAGGTLRIPEAGFTLTIPSGAIQGEPVAIRATALPGGNVAYRFEPHGLVFHREPVITQNLGLTRLVGGLLSLSQYEGGYVADESLLGSGTAAVQEVRPAQVDLLRMRMTFGIQHFSTYVVSTRRGRYVTSTGDHIPTGGTPIAAPHP